MLSKPQSNLKIFLILSSLTVLSPLALDAFLPAAKDAARHFNCSIGQIMISWGVLSAGNGIGQIFHGPFSDRYGRKPVLVIGLFTYFLASVLSIFMDNLISFYAVRFFQGIAMAATMIIMRSIVRDLYNIKQGAKIFSKLFVVLATIPVVGPVIGGILSSSFGWQSIFVMMALFSGVTLFVVSFFLTESLRCKDLSALRLNYLFGNFKEIIIEPNFLTFLLIGVGAYVGLFAILTGIAPVMIAVLGQTPENFGYQFGIIMLGHFIAANFTNTLVNRLGIKKLLFVGTSISLTGGLSLFAMVLLSKITIFSILVPSTLFLVGFALTIPGMTAGALSNFQHMAGRATSLLGFIHQGTGALVAIVLGYFADGYSAMAYAVVLASGAIFGSVIYFTKIPNITLGD